MGITRDRINLIKQNEEEMFSLYVKLGQDKFMDMMGIPRGSANSILGKNGLNWFSRDREVKSLREELSYKNWISLETQESWYFLGYFLGDGCLRKKETSYNINVSSKDLQVLEEFSKRFDVKIQRSSNKNGEWYEINLYSEKLYNWMLELGFRPRKSVEGCLIKEPKREFIGSFLRGLLDSDGYLRFVDNCKEVIWYGHSSYMTMVKELVCQLGFKCRTGYKENLYYVAIYGVDDLEDLFYELYPDENVIKLERKFNRYKEWMESRSNIDSVTYTGESINMMDMEVEDIHQYYADGILVLNCAQELRMQANLANVKVWVDTFTSGGDLHKNMAIAMWGEENYDKEKRKKAKVLNFGMLYGMSAYTLAERFHISLEEGQDIVNRYWKAVPEIQAYQKAMLRKAKKEGTTYNYYGGPRRVKYYLNSDDPRKRAFGARTVGNNPIQSSCATMTQIAFLKVYQRLYSNPEWRDDCHFFSFIHDEILSSVKKERVLDFIKIQKECMTTKYSNMPVTFETSVAIGNKWGNMFEFKWSEDGGIEPDMERVEE